MYKCDGCAGRRSGELPACAAACPKGAMHFGTLAEMTAKLESLASGRHVYGREENGGTATWYISSVSFEDIEDALRKARGAEAPQGEPGFGAVSPQLEDSRLLAGATLAAPVIALGGALALRRRRKSGGES